MKTMFLLAESLDRLSPTERRVAEHILSLGDHLLKTTISEIAYACGTGKSVVVQTCKKAGYKGFKDLCSAFSVSKAMSSKRPIPTGYYIDLYPGLAHEDICRLVISSILHAIEGTLELTDMQEIRRAADMTAGARRILLLGAGASGIVAQDTYYKLQRIGLDPQFTPDVHCQQLATVTLDERDCAIAFSYSGQTIDVLEAARLAKLRGTPIIAVTRKGDNALGTMADIRLNVTDGETTASTGALTSRHSMLAAMDMLTTCIASGAYTQTLQNYESANEISRKHRSSGRH